MRDCKGPMDEAYLAFDPGRTHAAKHTHVRTQAEATATATVLGTSAVVAAAEYNKSFMVNFKSFHFWRPLEVTSFRGIVVQIMFHAFVLIYIIQCVLIIKRLQLPTLSQTSALRARARTHTHTRTRLLLLA